VTRTRAADDFATIRAHVEELRRVARPRAADDFPVIRARMEELRRERAQILAEARGRSVIGPRSYYRPATSEPQDEGQRRPFSRSIRLDVLAVSAASDTTLAQ
jgi:hypothetical protein